MITAPGDSPANVLVVEDEMILRMRAVDIVEDAGFTAVEAINADEALAILEKRSDISLLFSDIQMPGTMDGLMLAYAVHARWPSIKIILVSGQIKLSDADRPANSVFFEKPLVVKQMISELRAMVGAGALRYSSRGCSACRGRCAQRNGARRRASPRHTGRPNGGERHSAAVARTGRHRRQGPARASRHRCQGARGRRQIASAYPGGVASSH